MKANLLLTYLFVSLISVSIGLAQAPNLGTAATFALFTANGAFANTGASTVTGDIGTNVGAFTGFPPGTVNGQIRLPGSTEADQAATDVTAAYNMLSQLTCTTTIPAELGGQTLTPGVHCQPAPDATSLNGTLTLSGAGVFVIKLNSALTTATNSTISLINGASACDVYFQVNGAVGLGTGSTFKGTILAAGAISLGTDASLEGRGLSTAGAISLNNNVVTVTNSVLSIDVVVGACSPATNLYSISGNILSTSAPATTVTVTDGTVSKTVEIAAGETSTPYTLTGLVSGTGNHIVRVSCAGNTDSATYVAPASCTTSSASLGGMVYSDNNGNGVSDGGDTPIMGATATLLDSTGAAITSTTTSGTGLYSFPGLTPGIPYSVSFTTPTGFSATTPTVAGPVTLAADENNTSLSAGFQPVSATIVSVTVTPGATDSTTNQYTLTGVISLTNAPAGSLTVTDGDVTTTLPITAGQTSASFNLPKLTSGTGSRTVVVSGSGYTPFTATYAAPASIVPANSSLGDFVWKDLNDNGRQDAGEPGVAGVKLKLLDKDGKYVATGLLSGSQEVPPVTTSASGYVKTALDTTTNMLVVNIKYTGLTGPPQAGHIHQGQPGVNGPVKVPLTGLPAAASGTYTTTVPLTDSLKMAYMANGLYVNIHTTANPGGELRAQLNACAITDAMGKYTFSALDSASYRVLVDKKSIPDSCLLSTKLNAAGVSDSLDSDFSPTTGISDAVTVNPNDPTKKDITTVDLALVNKPDLLGSIGDYVFKDKNDNGLQDAGDVPVQGVKLNLYVAAAGTKTGQILASDTTDASGKYLFDKLAAGDYIVEIVRTTLPDTCQITTKKDVNANGNDKTDSDFDAATGLSQVVTLAPKALGPNSTPADSLATNNLTVDAGLVTKPNVTVDLALDKSVNKKLAMLGDTIIYTLLVRNEGTTNATGVEVTDSLTAGVQYLSSTGTGTFSEVSKIWTIGNLAGGDSASIQIKVRVVAQGVWFNTAQISKTNEKDIDSTPGNNIDGEDDIDRECFTVPVLVCRGQGQGVQLSVPAQYTGVVWFRKTQGGQPAQVATGNTYVATETDLGSYEYTFTSTSGTCPADGCCPVTIVVEDCCPPQVCVPFTVKKRKK